MWPGLQSRCFKTTWIQMCMFRWLLPRTGPFHLQTTRLVLKCWGTLSREVTLSFMYFFPSQGCLLSKERICSSWSKFFPLRVNPSLEGQCKQTGSHKSCCPLVKIAEKHGGVPIQVSKKEYCPMMSIIYHDHKYIAPAYKQWVI